jgi:hypothetical protein
LRRLGIGALLAPRFDCGELGGFRFCLEPLCLGTGALSGPARGLRAPLFRRELAAGS